MLSKIFAFLIAVATAIESWAIPSSRQFEQKLLELQRQGSCSDLPEFGVNTHRGHNPDEVNVQLLSELGAAIVRFDIAWTEVERDGKYNFRSYDNLVAKIRKTGKHLLLILAYGHNAHTDGFSQNGQPLPPANSEQRQAFYRYVQAVASRYHGPDIAYEIWNEPNWPLFWAPATDVRAYGRLLAGAAKAIRAVDPTATIISGGLANEYDPSKFQHALATSGALDLVDGIALHPYRQDAPEYSLYDIAKFTASSVIGGKSRPLWLTEWGYSVVWAAKLDPSHPRRRQAVMTARLMLTAALAKAKAALIYDLIDDGTDPQDQESNFGLYDYTFEPKESAIVFRTLTNLMSTCKTYEFRVDLSRKLVTATFRAEHRVSYVIWTYELAKHQDFCFADFGAKPIELKDIFGHSSPIEFCNRSSQVELKVSEDSGPVILQVEDNRRQ